MINPLTKTGADKLTEAMDDWNVERRERLISEIRQLRDACWCILGALAFIAFLILRLG